MQTSILGKTGLNVSRIALGAAWIGVPTVEESRVEAVLHGALDHGINFIDTAAMYQMSEQRIGRLLARRRDECTIATKCGCFWEQTAGGPQLIEDYSPQAIIRTVEQSRQKLNTDVIDLVQFHGLPPTDGLDAAFETLMGLKDKGYAKYVGVSEDGPAAAAFANKPTTGRDAAKIARQWSVDTWQFTYNFLSPQARDELIPTLAEFNIGTIVKRPLANVVWNIKDEPEGDYFLRPWQRAQQLPLDEIAAGLPMLEFAMRFVLSHPDVHTILVGTTNPQHIPDNVRLAAKGPLPGDILDNAMSILALNESQSLSLP